MSRTPAPSSRTPAPSSPADFDRLAALYRWAEYLALGPLLTRTRNHFLPQLTSAHQALVLGDGDGRFLAQLLRRAPHLHALAVDTSASMLRLLRRRCAFAGPRLSTLPVSVLALPQILPGTDLIATHFLLDCLIQDEVQNLATFLAGHVAPGCLWVVSDFAIPTREPWRTLGRIYIRGLYLAFRLLTGLRPQTLPEISRALTSAGFHLLHRNNRLRGLLFSELWQLPQTDLERDSARCGVAR